MRQTRRKDYPYFLSYQTRWSDNDQYSHMNNSVYYHLFDSVINIYLIEQCGFSPTSSDTIGLVVTSYCSFYRSLSFPQLLDLGLRVFKIGNSSVSYEVGVFEQGEDEPAAIGGDTYVFVDRITRKSVQMPGKLRNGLEKVRVPDVQRSKL
ncbi:thioesterase [Amanita muscaria]